MPDKIAFHVGRKNRNTCGTEAFGHDLQGDGFARAGGTRDQAVAVGQRQKQFFALVALAQKN